MVYTYIYIPYIYICGIYTYIHIYGIYIYIHIYICDIYIHIYGIYTHIYHIYTYICGIYIHIYGIYICIHIHTHTHINKLNRYFLKEDIPMVNRYTKMFSTPLIIREMQINTKMRYRFIPGRVVCIKKENMAMLVMMSRKR